MFNFFPKSKVSINNNKVNPGLRDQRPLLPWWEDQKGGPNQLEKVGGPKSISQNQAKDALALL